MYYRFSLDDNIEVFRDLASINYSSLFGQPYLCFLKEMHDKYKTCIQLNIYYEAEGFNLTQMPDRYKAEWCANADWLRLSFHALSDQPQRPYLTADYEEVRRDCELVQNEIIRFAGKDTLDPYTTLHWVVATKEGVKALYDCGIKGLVGLFGTSEKVEISYSLSQKICRDMQQNSFYFDRETDMWYIRNDLVINNYSIDELSTLLSTFKKREFFEIMIHEQYYLKNSELYQADFKEKVELVIKWLTEHDYKPVFLGKILDCRSYD